MDDMTVRFRRHLPRGLGGPKLSAQESCTLKILRELIYCILEWLPPESVVAFALTCRTFFDQYFPRPSQLTLDEAKRLRELLARDIPKLHLCHDCGRLHRWRLLRISPKRQLRVSRLSCGSVDFRNRLMNGTIAEVLGNNLTFSLFQLVMKRHFYGPGHGPRVEEIAVTKQTFFHSHYGMRITRSWDAKIINDRLYLHGNLVLRASSWRRENSPEDFIYHHAWNLVCLHTYPMGPMGIWSILAPVEGRPWTRYPRPTPPSAMKVRSCTVCFTDYRVVVKAMKIPIYVRALLPKGELYPCRWLIEIDRWHRLGECRSPHDPQWNNLVKIPGMAQVITKRRDEVCLPGSIREEWLGEDVVDDEGQIESGVHQGG